MNSSTKTYKNWENWTKIPVTHRKVKLTEKVWYPLRTFFYLFGRRWRVGCHDVHTARLASRRRFGRRTSSGMAAHDRRRSGRQFLRSTPLGPRRRRWHRRAGQLTCRVLFRSNYTKENGKKQQEPVFVFFVVCLGGPLIKKKLLNIVEVDTEYRVTQVWATFMRRIVG